MRDPQDIVPALYDSNGCEVYPGESVYYAEVQGRLKCLCPDCFAEWIKKDLSPDEIADAFGIEKEVAS